MEIWIVLAVLAGFALIFGVALWLGGLRHESWLDKRERRRHEEQLEWRRSGRLPVRYSTTYAVGEMVDEDMARMLELGYYVAEDADLVTGSRRVIYRLQGVSAL